MELPKWDMLTERERGQLLAIASSFGINLSKPHDKTDNGLILPDKAETYSIALEMFTLSRSIIYRHLKETADG